MADTQFGSAPTFDVDALYVGAQSSVEVIAGSTGQKIVVDHLIFSTNAAGYFDLEQNGVRKGPRFYLGANTGINMKDLDMTFDEGEGVDLSSNISTGHSIYIQYHLKNL